MLRSTEEESEPSRIRVEREELEAIEEVTYLGSRITRDGRSLREIASRIHEAKIAFNLRKNLLASKNISLEIGKQDCESICLDCGTWTVGRRERGPRDLVLQKDDGASYVL